MNLRKALELLTPEQRADAENRDMLGSVKSVKAYLWEIVEVEKADKRMKKIDLAISKMSCEKQEERRNRIESQRRSFNEVLYDIQN